MWGGWEEHLQPASRRSTEIEHCFRIVEEAVLFVELDELEGCTGAIPAHSMHLEGLAWCMMPVRWIHGRHVVKTCCDVWRAWVAKHEEAGGRACPTSVG